MPISGSTIPPTSAQLKLGRLGAMRLKYTQVSYISIGGSNATAKIRLGTATIHDLINESPNTAEFIHNGPTAPLVGQSVSIIRLGRTLFAGAIERVEEAYDLRKQNLAWRVTCQDWTRNLQRRVKSK